MSVHEQRVTVPIDNPGTRPHLSGVVSAIGFVLALSYPILALSAGVRAGYQLLVRQDLIDPTPAYLSLVASICFLLAAIGFAYRRRWTWYLSVVMLAFEMVMVVLVGSLSLIDPDLLGRTVWRNFGADYGYFPLIQPILGLVWLFWPGTRAAYAGARSSEPQPAALADARR